MSYQDQTLSCAECGQPFTFSADDQAYHAQKGYTNQPKRCPTCRQSRRDQRYSGGGGGGYGGGGGGYGGGGGGYGRREMFSVPLKAGTLPHEYTADFGAAKVLMKPASHGTGVIAGGAVRAIMEAAGVTDVLTKSLGSRNPVNVARATVKGLAALRDPDIARDLRLALLAEAAGEGT